MRFVRPGTLGLIFFLTLSGNSLGDSNPYQIDASLDTTIRDGLRELYTLHFKEAEEIFNSLQDKSAEHPMVALALATVYWWRISVEVTENDPVQSRPFLEAADQCIALSLAKIKAGDPTGEAHLTLGSVYALLTRWEAANHHWMAVYHREKKARAFLTKALKINPDAADAYMALGIFDYTLSTLPKAVRFLSGARLNTTPLDGLRELEIAADKGIYLRLPAAFLLASIYSEDLKEPFKAVDILTRLRSEYPTSPFIDFMMFTALYNADCPVEMSVEADDGRALIENGVYRPEFIAQAHFLQGLVHFKSRRWQAAVENFDLAIHAAAEESPFKIWATTYQGYAFDALGEREKALQNYRAVLRQRPRWRSHDAAEKKIKRPFREKDPEGRSLLL